MTTIRRKIASVLAAVLCLSLLAVPAGAYVRVDESADVSLTLSYEHDQTPIQGMDISLYKVYNMSDAVEFDVMPDFEAAYPDFNFDTDSEEWAVEPTQSQDPQEPQLRQVNWEKMALNLETLLRADIANNTVRVEPVLIMTTDENGQVKFESVAADPDAGTEEVKLDPGLYLVMGKSLSRGSYTYTPKTFLTALPSLEPDDTWNYDPSGTNKQDIYYHAPATRTITVQKEWLDEDVEDVERPASIQVQLIHNGYNYGLPVTLNEGNNWSYSWFGVPASGSVLVAEVDVPEGYTMWVEQLDATSFLITNSADTEIDPGDVPLDPGPGGEDGDPGDPGDPGDEIDIPEDDVPLSPGLPQTGTLWWPVPFLTMGGLVLFLLGWVDGRRNRREQDDA